MVEAPKLQGYQVQAPVLAQVTAPPLPGVVAPAQLDISGILNSILPIMMLMLVFGMIVPLFKQLSGALTR
jgi:hypothetical protein